MLGNIALFETQIAALKTIPTQQSASLKRRNTASELQRAERITGPFIRRCCAQVATVTAQSTLTVGTTRPIHTTTRAQTRTQTIDNRQSMFS